MALFQTSVLKNYLKQLDEKQLVRLLMVLYFFFFAYSWFGLKDKIKLKLKSFDNVLNKSVERNLDCCQQLIYNRI